MKQAMTLTDAQQKRVLQYCATRRHPTRDKTIVLFSLHTGLRAMELAALKLGDVFDEDGSVKSQFQLAQRNTKGSNARTVFVNTKLRKALKDYGEQSNLTQPERALFPRQYLLFHTANMTAVSHSTAVSHNSHVCCFTQQTGLLCHTADMPAVWRHSRHVCCVTQQTFLL